MSKTTELPISYDNYLELVERVLLDFGRDCYPSEIKNLTRYAFEKLSQKNLKYPMEDEIEEEEVIRLVMNNDFYSDSCLGRYREELRKDPRHYLSNVEYVYLNMKYGYLDE